MTSTPDEQGQLDQLQRAALALKRMRTRLDTLECQRSEPIAIIGLGCRFPGADANVSGPEEFWRLLCAGEDAISVVPPDRWDAEGYYDPSPDAPGKMYTRWGGFLREIDRFDAQLFGIAPREAASMDPQQRLLLEVAWEALEHAGVAPDSLKKSGTGVFVGIGIGDYSNMQLRPEHRATIDAYTGTGSGFCFASGRLSYILGAQGPSLSVDTACSSSLVALHLACQSLRAQECRVALAGGVNAMLAPEAMLFLAKSRALSPTGRCRTFDADADGFVRGEGCGVLVLKRLSDAQADGDPVLAVICGSAINHDGPSSGLTVPNGLAQQALLRQALEQALIDPADVQYVEAHGTGTPLGDPIEVRALGAVLGAGRPPESPLLVGSVKTNIGHLEAAAGVAGVIKVVLALQHGQIPPHLHFRTPSPHIPWGELPVAVPAAPQPWPTREGRRRVAGVSSFGLSGTNAHVLLAEAPPRDTPASEASVVPQLLTLSARSAPALRALAARYERHLAADPALNLADLCFTANTGRAALGHGLGLVADTPEQARALLAGFAAGGTPDGLFNGERPGPRPRIAFLFTGQGAQHAGMGRELYTAQPVFRAALDRCAEILLPLLGEDIRQVIFEEPEHESTKVTKDTNGSGQEKSVAQSQALSAGDAELNIQNSKLNTPAGEELKTQHPKLKTTLAQPALFALEYALAELWRSWGVRPDVLLGHSLGEYVAACVAGVFSLEDGLRLVAERARLMGALPAGGAMLAVFAPEEQVRAAAEGTATVAVAAVNGPLHTVLSGPHAALEPIAARFAAQEIGTRWLEVSHAFHSPLMAPMLAEFARTAESVRYAAPQIDLVSNLSGALDAGQMATPGYWVEHILRPVLFADGVRALGRAGCDACVEIGPRPVLLGLGRQCLPEDGAPLWLPSLRPGRLSDTRQMLASLAALCAHGLRPDWGGFYQGRTHRRVALPTYPFQRQRYWLANAGPALQPRPQEEGAPALRRVVSPAFSRGEVQFELLLDHHTPGLTRDRASGMLALGGPALADLALAAGAAALGAEAALAELAAGQELCFSEEESRALQILLLPAGAGYSFQVLSQPAPGGAAWQVHASGMLLKAGEAAGPLAVPATWERWLYQAVWRAGGPMLAPAATIVGTWLVLADADGVGRKLAGLLRERGARCVLAYAGAAFAQQAADEYRVDPGSAADLARLVEICGGEPLAGVVSLWALDAPFGPDIPALRLQEAVLRVCAGAAHLVQALVASDRPSRLWLATRGSQPAGCHALRQPQGAPLWGLGHVVALEHPELRCVCVDLDPADPAGAAHALLGELGAPGDERRIALREGLRYLARLEEGVRPEQPDRPQVRADGSYLISGGLGGLGLRVARWLAEQGAGGLALLGRRPPTAEQRAELAALERAGARVLVVQADVADAEAMAAALAQIGMVLPPLRGVVHAAGGADDALLRQQSPERFARVLSPKVAGAWNLHTLTAGLALDWFVCFSSAAGLLGSPGQANYAAANAFLDGLAHYRRGQGLPALSVDWGPWAEVGMEAGNERRRAAQGVALIPPDDGLRALGGLLGDGVAQACVLRAHWTPLLEALAPPSAFFAALRPRDEAPARRATLGERMVAVHPAERRAWLAAALRETVALVLGAPPEQIAPREGLFEQGLDSLMALEVKRRLEDSLGRALRQTFVFDFPTIDAMVDYLAREQFADLLAPQPVPAPEPPQADLAGISEDEAEALLLEMLDRMKR